MNRIYINKAHISIDMTSLGILGSGRKQSYASRLLEIMSEILKMIQRVIFPDFFKSFRKSEMPGGF